MSRKSRKRREAGKGQDALREREGVLLRLAICEDYGQRMALENRLRQLDHRLARCYPLDRLARLIQQRKPELDARIAWAIQQRDAQRVAAALIGQGTIELNGGNASYPRTTTPHWRRRFGR